MSLLEPSETSRARSVPAQLRSNWIEIFAVPIASAIMETQPVAVALLLIVPHIFSSESAYPDAASITLLLLFLHWWSMGTRYVFERRGASPGIFTLYDILGIVVALVLLAGTHLDVIADSTFLFIALVIIGLSWKRGADRARAGLNEEQLITAFKIGFIALLASMVFALLALFAGEHDLTDTLLHDLPIFFLAGMITLSFTRIGILKKEQERHTGGRRREKTGSWLVALTMSWVMLVVVSIALEALPLQTIMELLSPLWYVLGLLAWGLINILDFIVSTARGLLVLLIWLILLLFPKDNRPPVPVAHPAQAAQAAQDSTTTLVLLRIIIVILIIIAAILITRYFQKRRRTGADDELDEEEELREGLDINQILRARREERRQRPQALPLAALDQGSVRARYRDFLTAMAARGQDVARRAHETPAEYQRRVLDAARTIPASSDTAAPDDPTILSALTQAYSRERYGEKQAGDEQQSFLRQWMPHLIQRFSEHLTGKQKNRTTTYTTLQSRWGED